jgi:two-component system sensor histidine kinase GlrK
MEEDSSSWPVREKRARLTIFNRLTLSYLLILSLVTAMVLYAVFQFQRLNRIAGELQNVHRRIIDSGEKLADTLLSEVRYEKKFVITRAPVHLNQFGQFARDFERDFDALLPIAKYPELQDTLRRIRASHNRYQYLFAEEIEHLKAGRYYAQRHYQREKDKTVDATIAALERLTGAAQQNTNRMLSEIESAAGRARSLSLALTGLFLVLAIATSLLITKSITRPIALLKEKSKRIAEGNLSGELELPVVPEIRELAETFNVMCEKLRNLDRMKSEFFFSMSKKLCIPLTSIKERIDFLADELDGVLSANQKVKMAILAEESTHLIAVVNSLVELSKMESGLATYHFEPTPLASVIDRTLAEVAPLAKTKEIALSTDGADLLPDIKMDSAKFAQALRTLVGNALQLTAKGGSLVITSRGVERGVQVSITGTQLEKAEKRFASLFDVADAANAANGDYGADLGWAMAKHIIHSHGGSLWVETRPHQGTSFSLVLPS